MIEELKRTPWFSKFSDDALQTLVPSVTVEEAPKGEYLFREGESGECFYVIASGAVEILKEEKILAVLPAGALFGEMVAFLGRRTADARVRTDATLYRIDNDAFKKLLTAHPEESVAFLYDGLEEMAHRLARSTDNLVTLYETGKIVTRDVDLSQLSRSILAKLRERIPEASGGMMLLANPFTGGFEVTGSVDSSLFTAESAIAFVEEATDPTTDEVSHTVDGGVVLRVPLRDGEKILGYILLERRDGKPFDSQQEIISLAVGDQVGLGILNAYHRQEEQARQRLEQSRWRRY